MPSVESWCPRREMVPVVANGGSGTQPGPCLSVKKLAGYPYDQLGSIGFAIYQGLPSHTRHNQQSKWQSKAHLPRLSKLSCILSCFCGGLNELGTPIGSCSRAFQRHDRETFARTIRD